jgi:hypothetical protein
MDAFDCKTSQRPGRFRRFASTALVIVSCLTSGCQTWQKSHECAVTEFGEGDLDSAKTALQKSQNSIRSEKHLLELDQGILDLAGGDVGQAETRFRTIRRELEHLEQKDLTEQASSMLTDSRAVAFSGRDFERRMVLNLALLTSMVGDGQDAFAYSLQVAEAAAARRDAIAAAQKPESSSGQIAEQSNEVSPQITSVRYVSESTELRAAPFSIAPSSSDQTLALSSYLAAAVQSEQPSRFAETEKALAEIGYWNPSYRRREQAVTPGEFGVRCQAGNGSLHVIAMVGRAPRWVSESAQPTSAALLIADRIISAAGKHTLPPTIASVKIARPEPYPNLLPAGGLRCKVASSAASDKAGPDVVFSTIVDLNEVAQASYSENRDEEIAAVIARRVMKKGAIYVLKETQKVHRNSLVDLGVNVAGVAWEAMEKPDTRSWRMLPARIDVAHAELPAGSWTATFQVSRYQHAGAQMTIPVDIADGRNTYVLCIIPESSLAGQILVGGADKAAFAVE